MNVLDTIDTTVTFEWGNTRTVGALVRLEGRAAVVTALRAPDEGTPVYLRLEGESEADSAAPSAEEVRSRMAHHRHARKIYAERQDVF